MYIRSFGLVLDYGNPFMNIRLIIIITTVPLFSSVSLATNFQPAGTQQAERNQDSCLLVLQLDKNLDLASPADSLSQPSDDLSPSLSQGTTLLGSRY